MAELIPADKTRLLLVEGQDDEVFFDRYLDHIATISDALIQASALSIIQYGGKDQLSRLLRELRNAENFELVTHIGIVRDADFNTDAFQSIQSAINSANRRNPVKYPVPRQHLEVESGQPNMMALVLPAPEREGTLETVLLQALADDPEMRCVDEYFECVKNQRPESEVARNRVDKQRLGVLLSGKLIIRDLARNKDATRELPRYMYNMKWWHDGTFDHPAFNPAKAFLTQLLAN